MSVRLNRGHGEQFSCPGTPALGPVLQRLLGNHVDKGDDQTRTRMSWEDSKLGQGYKRNKKEKEPTAQESGRGKNENQRC